MPFESSPSLDILYSDPSEDLLLLEDEYAGAGAIAIGLSVAGTGHRISTGTGTLSARAGVNGPATAQRTAAGVLTFEAPALAGTATMLKMETGMGAFTISGAISGVGEKVLVVIRTATGSMTIPAILVHGTGHRVDLWFAVGELLIPAPLLAGQVTRLSEGSFAVTIPAPVVAGLATLVAAAQGAFEVQAGISGAATLQSAATGFLSFPAPVLAGTGEMIPPIPGSGALEIAFALAGAAARITSAVGHLHITTVLAGSGVKRGIAAGVFQVSAAVYGRGKDAARAAQQVYRVRHIEKVPGRAYKALWLTALQTQRDRSEPGHGTLEEYAAAQAEMATTQMYRVTGILKVPGKAYKGLQIEAVQRPVDK